MHFQVWRILALVALVFVFSSTAINPDAIDKVDGKIPTEVNGIIGHFEKSGHSIQKRDDEPEEPDEEPEEPTTMKSINKKKTTTPNPVHSGDERGNEQSQRTAAPVTAPVTAPVAAQDNGGGGGFWGFLKNVANIVSDGFGKFANLFG